MEIDACWDAPQSTDVQFDELSELFGDDSIPEEIDHRYKTTTYNQWAQPETKMMCWPYGIRHIINLSNKLTGGTIDDPRRLANRFCNAFTTPTYNPIVSGTSLQDNMKFTRRLWLTEADYKIPVTSDIEQTKDKMMSAMSKWHFLFTGSGNIDWGKTRASKDKVAVIGSWAKHIICMIGGNKNHAIIQQSYGEQSYDKWYMYLRRDDVGALFSVYGIIDRAMPSTLLKIRNLINKKKKVSVPKWITMNGIPTLVRQPKE